MKNTDIPIGTLVELPDPTGDDIWMHSFQATVVDYRGENLIVEDQDSDFYEIEPNRVELVDEE